MEEANQKQNLSFQIAQLEEEYNNYIDSSEVVMEYYKNQQTSGLDKHFLKIEEWLDQDVKGKQNLPLVIEAEDGVGKKTLLVKWIGYHNANKKGRYQDIIIPHFAMVGGNNSNYFYAIYRILVKLRELLNIGQKVELLEEKLRKYFAYWLDICNSHIENQILKEAKTLYNRVILIFEGVNHFVDQGNGIPKEANVSFWLPQFFPSRIKVILTASKNSGAMQYLQKINAQIIQIKVEPKIIEKMIETHKKRKTFLSDSLKDKLLNILSQTKCEMSSIFCKTFLSLLIPYPSVGIIGESDVRPEAIETLVSQIDMSKLQEVTSLEDLVNFILDHYQAKMFKDQEKFIKMLLCFTITQKGLIIQEALTICQLNENDWKIFLVFFKVYLMHYKEYWIINNDIFKSIIQKRYIKENSSVPKLHEEIADHLNKSTNSIRKLEEQTYHLFMAKTYFKLKEIVSAIENFLLLFNPNNKYDLCRYWQKLEEQGFDPVIEYNKAIEGFAMQYHPSSEDIFRIIVQVSRFLKEFCDFETYYTPSFRHPPIQGIEDELDDIGLLNELYRMNLCYIIDANPIKIGNNDENYKSPQERINEKIEKLKSKQVLQKDQKQTKKPGKEEDIKKTQPTISLLEKKKKPQILTKLEKLNVDIPYNREQVKKFFEEKIGISSVQEEKLREKESEEAKIYQKLENGQISMRDLDINLSKDEDIQLKKPGQLKLTHNQIQVKKLEEQSLVSERKPTDYYYKRWIWIQFPWVCLSVHSDYSAKMKQCFAKATEYMSVQEEKAFTKQALKIAIEAKLKKKMMYQKQEDLNTTNIFNDKELSVIPVKQEQNTSILTLMRQQNELPGVKGFRREKSLADNTINNQNHKSTYREVKSTKMHTTSLQFFITEDQMSLSQIHKEIEEQKKQQQQNQVDKKQTTLPAISKTQEVSLNTTMRIIDKSKMQKEKYKQFNPETINKSSQSILPRLKSEIALHNGKELYIMLQQAKDLKKELDNIIYQNQAATKKLANLRTLQHNEGFGTDVDTVSQIQDKIENLKKLREEAEHDYLLSMVQDSRLRIIIKISGDNRSYNEEWIRDLNYLQCNLNKLIKYEKQDIIKMETEIKQIHTIHIQYVDAFNNNMNYSKQMIDQINKTVRQKEDFDHFFQQSDSIIQQQSSEKMQKLQQQYAQNEDKEQQRVKRIQLEKNSKAISDKLEVLRSTMAHVSQYIEIENPDYSKEQNFVEFLNQLEIKTSLEAKISFQEDLLSDLHLKLHKQKMYLDTFKNANSNEHKKQREKTIKYIQGKVQGNETIQMLIEKRDLQLKQNQAKEKQKNKLQLSLLDYKISIKNIRSKIQQSKLKNQSEQGTAIKITLINDIYEDLTKRQNFIKEKLGEEMFQQFLNKKLDFNKVYKAAFKYHQDPTLTQMEPY
ncbi:unnamed protein product [Paramecium pentaurelia]|uniref:NACHT domain-containing protein n=1 Tax=Paramecium pentaurelia TaxID=43138 RepID=A0A8S1VK91_9CILI|nr:unnamed protein product [Paramecium pentaurelia]